MPNESTPAKIYRSPWSTLIIVWAVVGLCLVFVTDLGVRSGRVVQDHYEIIDVATALRLQRNPKNVFIDARSPEEYRINHIPGALNVPNIEAATSALVSQLKNAPHAVVYGARNPRNARRVAEHLGDRGVFGVKFYGAGWPEWSSLGLAGTK
jgi:rhodanese-related sulfurtransferase